MRISKLAKIYTLKQIEVLKHVRRNKKLYILILHGAKRAGKTVTVIDIFLNELREVKKRAEKFGVNEPQYILASSSLSSIDRNIFNELRNRWGIDPKLDKKNTFRLFGVRVCCFGHDNIGYLSKVRGFTSWGALINEGTMANEEVFREILDRCSGVGSRIIVDTNPDNPKHWLKKDYIDKADNEIITQFQFELDDNTFLDPENVANRKATTPSGMFYDRNIRGLWVTADGIIYPDYNSKLHKVDNLDRFNFIQYFCGVDWGYEHYGSMVLFGLTDNDEVVLIKEITAQHKNIEWWAKKGQLIKENFGNILFYCDSARPEYVQEFNNKGLKAVNANKSVIEGISTVATMIISNKFYVYEKGIDIFEDQIYSYVWADGKDEPLKKNDDVMDAVRYAIHSKLSNFNRATAIKGLKV